MNIDELIKSNVNLEDYLREYGENSTFLLAYYLQDRNRIASNYCTYGQYLSNDDKLKLFDNVINNSDYYAINTIIRDIDSLCYADDTKSTASVVFNKLIELDKDGKIDINSITSSVFLYRSNPMYFVKKNPENIRYYYSLDENTTNKILAYLVSINYKFVEKDESFITYCVLPKKDSFTYFLKNCEYDPNIDRYIEKEFNEFTKEELNSLYHSLLNNGKEHLEKRILTKLNYNNYDYNTIIPDRTLCFNCDNNEKERLMEALKAIGSSFKANIILIMNRIDINLVNEAYELVGDNLKIMPLTNQAHNDFQRYSDLEEFPFYDVDYIRKSEDKLNSYASMVSDTKDRDGDIKSLSPLEKFVAAYILTSKFAPYKGEDNWNDAYKSRSVYEFINSTTDTRIVCVGYTHLLKEILYRMGITDTIDWSVNSSMSANKKFTDHMRMMIHLVDPKYGIDGIYMSDPTWDNREDTDKDFSHMLLSHDEAMKVDNLSNEKDFRLDEIKIMEDELKVSDAYDLFRRPIPKEALIKAHLAFEHFFDREMKMAKDNQYDVLEYSEMAIKLNFSDEFFKYKDEVWNKLCNMTINEINYNYPDLFSELIREIVNNFSERLGIKGLKGLHNNITVNNQNDKLDSVIVFGLRCYFKTEDTPDCDLTLEEVQEAATVFPNCRIKEDYGMADFYLPPLDNSKTVMEQLDKLYESLAILNDMCTNKTSKEEQASVK